MSSEVQLWSHKRSNDTKAALTPHLKANINVIHGLRVMAPTLLHFHMSKPIHRSVNVFFTHTPSVDHYKLKNKIERERERGALQAVGWYILRPRKPLNVCACMSLDRLNQCSEKMQLLLLRAVLPLVLMEPGNRVTGSNLFWRD